MKRHTILLFSLLLMLCLSVAPSVMAASAEDEVLQQAPKFAEAHNSQDFEMFSSLFLHSPKASSFEPSNNPFLNQGWEAVENYFKSGNFGLPKGTFLTTFHHPQVTMLADNVALLNGYENVVYTDPNTKKQSIDQLRITRVLQKVEGKWLIVHQHVSVLPTTK